MARVDIPKEDLSKLVKIFKILSRKFQIRVIFIEYFFRNGIICTEEYVVNEFWFKIFIFSTVCRMQTGFRCYEC